MILGNLCTRGCGFCSVPKGNPAHARHAARSRGARQRGAHGREMKLRYVVITSVNRDDLEDGGSAHFAETVREVEPRSAGCPRGSAHARFRRQHGRRRARARRRPARLQPQYGDRAAPLSPRAPPGEIPAVARRAPFRAASSSGRDDQIRLHGGAGRNREEVEQLLRDLREQDVDVATIGQYLQPTRRNLPVAEYVHAGTVSTTIAISDFRSASKWCSAAPWCAVPTWPTW